MNIKEQLLAGRNDQIAWLDSLDDGQLNDQHNKWMLITEIIKSREIVSPGNEEEQVSRVVEELCHAAPEHSDAIRDAYHAICEQNGWYFG